MTRTIRATALATSCVLSAHAPASAGNTPVEINAASVSTRIDLAGRQRMLSERMAMYFCYARSGVDATESVLKLAEARALFETTHLGFVDGHAEMTLFAEGNPSVRASWDHVDQMFQPLAAIYDRALGGDEITERDFDESNRLTREVRKRANDMVARLRAAYAPVLGTSGFGQALLIDLYGRQRMLSQKLSKEVCLAARGHDREATMATLNETLRLFETSLNAFIDGMPVVGVPKPPTPEIAAQLARAQAEWLAIRTTAASVAAGNAVAPADLARFAQGTNTFLVEMNRAVRMLAALDNTSS